MTTSPISLTRTREAATRLLDSTPNPEPPIEERINKRKETIDALSRSTVLFGRVMLPSLFTKPPCPMHFDVDAILHNDSIDQAVVVAPRGHAKSTLVSNAHPLNLVLSSAMYGRKEYILIISKTQTLSDELLGTIKYALSHNEKIQALYGDYGERTALSWTKSRAVLKNDTVIHRAIRHGKKGDVIVQELVNEINCVNGINIQNDDGDTPLHLVMKTERSDKSRRRMCLLLVSRGAVAGIKNKDGVSPMTTKEPVFWIKLLTGKNSLPSASQLPTRGFLAKALELFRWR